MSPIPSQASKKGGNRFRKSNYHEMWFIAFQSMFCLITKAHKALPMQLQVWNTSWCLDLTLPKLPLWWPIVICQCLWNVIFFNSWKKNWIHFANYLPSATNLESFSPSLEQFFLTVGQNNFGNKIPGPQNTIFTHTYLPSLRYTYFAIFSLNQDVRSKSVKSLLLFWWATDIGFCFTLANILKYGFLKKLFL